MSDEDNPNIADKCNLTLPSEKSSFRLTMEADIEIEAEELTARLQHEIAQDVEIMLNDWVGAKTPDGVEVELEKL